MNESNVCIGGDGGPLIVLQMTAALQWQGANDFESISVGDGYVETDYDIICDSSMAAEGISVITHYDRDMLILWDCEFGASVVTPHLLQLPHDTMVLTQCYPNEELPYILPLIRECIQQGKPERSLLLNIQDTMLRLQVGADSPDPKYFYSILDVPTIPGVKRCDVYSMKHSDWRGEIAIIKSE